MVGRGSCRAIELFLSSNNSDGLDKVINAEQRVEIKDEPRPLKVRPKYRLVAVCANGHKLMVFTSRYGLPDIVKTLKVLSPRCPYCGTDKIYIMIEKNQTNKGNFKGNGDETGLTSLRS